MNWPIWLFVGAMVGLFAGFVATRKALFIPVMALVVYLAVDFSLWTVLKWGFWISVILALIAIVLVARKFVIVFGTLALVIAIGAASFGTWSLDGDDDDKSPRVTLPSAGEDARNCPDTWLIVQSDNEHNRWFADGVQEIRDADTPKEAKEAAHTWLSLVRRDPELLAGASAYFVDRQVDSSILVDGKCASTVAEQLVAEIELAIAEAKVTPDSAPVNGVNSGVSDGNVVAAEHSGITGDRDAILIELPDGKKIWIMARCGNPVVVGPPPVPPGPTDQPPTGKPVCPEGLVPEGGMCVHPKLSDDCMQNGIGCPPGVVNDVVQPPQDNDTSGVNTGPTPGAPSEPSTPPSGPVPEDGTSAPPPNDGGYDSGSPDGSGTPDGSTCDSSGCTGGGPAPADEGPPPTVEPDPTPIGGDPGGF